MKENQLLLTGTYSNGNEDYYYRANISEELRTSNITSFLLPSRIIIASTDFYDNIIHIFGTVINDQKSYNYLYMKDYGSHVQFYQSGSYHIDYLVGQFNNVLVGYSASHNNSSRSDLVFLDNEISSAIQLIKEDSFILETDVFKSYEIIEKFQRSSINKGCERVVIDNIKTKIR